MGRPSACNCQCGDSSDSSASSSSDSEFSSGDSSWSSISGSAGCFDCCGLLPVEFSLWWPGVTRPVGTTPGWLLSCLGPVATYLCPPRGTYRLRNENCRWLWTGGAAVPGCWAWVLDIVCVRDLVSPPAGIPPEATRVRLQSAPTCLGTIPGVTPLMGVWEQIILPSDDPLRCAQTFELLLTSASQTMGCVSPVPPFIDTIGSYTTPATVRVWPS